MADFSKFFDYFAENMGALGLPASREMFGNVGAAVASINGLEAYILKYGKKLTVRELIGAGFRFDKNATLGAMYASFYLGAAIGSLAVATARCMGGGLTLGEILFSAAQHGFASPWAHTHLAQNRVIWDQNMQGRSVYATLGRA